MEYRYDHRTIQAPQPYGQWSRRLRASDVVANTRPVAELEGVHVVRSPRRFEAIDDARRLAEPTGEAEV